MLETVFLKVKEDRVDALKHWMEELRQREDEVLETFRREGARHEAAYLLESTEGPMLVYVQEAADPERAHRAFQESNLPVDLEHRQVTRDVVAGRLEVAKLFNLSMPDGR